MQTEDYMDSLNDGIDSLKQLRDGIKNTNQMAEQFKKSLNSLSGMERRLTRAAKSLIEGIEEYLVLTGVMLAGIERIDSRGKIVIKQIVESKMQYAL